jgi:hypothetical protein
VRAEDKDLVKGLTTLLIGFLPLDPGSIKALQVAAGYGVSKALSRLDRSTAIRIESIASEICQRLRAIPAEAIDNPGSNVSAAHDVISIAERTGLHAGILLECGLDASLLRDRLMSNAGPIVFGASAERRGLIERGINELSVTLIEHAHELPGVQLEFMRAVLRDLVVLRARTLPIAGIDD